MQGALRFAEQRRSVATRIVGSAGEHRLASDPSGAATDRFAAQLPTGHATRAIPNRLRRGREM